MSDKIVESAEFGEHIPLTCVNHPTKRWSTKNIAPIGCRTVFYNLHFEPNMGPECDCPLECLVPVTQATEQTPTT